MSVAYNENALIRGRPDGPRTAGPDPRSTPTEIEQFRDLEFPRESSSFVRALAVIGATLKPSKPSNGPRRPEPPLDLDPHEQEDEGDAVAGP